MGWPAAQSASASCFSRLLLAHTCILNVSPSGSRVIIVISARASTQNIYICTAAACWDIRARWAQQLLRLSCKRAPNSPRPTRMNKNYGIGRRYTKIHSSYTNIYLMRLFTSVKYDFSTIQHAIRFCGLLRESLLKKMMKNWSRGSFLSDAVCLSRKREEGRRVWISFVFR